MVNEHPERALIVSYAPADRRAALAAVLALDDRLRRIATRARDPLIAQMRLTWWHEALSALDRAPPPAEPLLRDLAELVLPLGVGGADLAALVEGAEGRLEAANAAEARDAAAQACARLFDTAARILGLWAADAAGWGRALGYAAAAAEAGEGGSASDRASALVGVGAAIRALRRAPRAARPLGALLLSARFDLGARHPPGHPARVARLAWYGLTGR